LREARGAAGVSGGAPDLKGALPVRASRSRHPGQGAKRREPGPIPAKNVFGATLLQHKIAFRIAVDILTQGILGKIFVDAFVYILASKKNGTLYTGVTSDLGQRVWQHKDEIFSGFTKKYGVKRLFWYREYDSIIEAIADEKRIKRWRREWKIKLIEEMNPDWNELYRGWGW
jgi:putative endonuclease